MKHIVFLPFNGATISRTKSNTAALIAVLDFK